MSTVLTAETLERVQKQLQKSYTNDEIDRSAYFLAAVPMTAASEIGAADNSPMALAVVTNLVGGALLAQFINRGLIDPTRISQYMDEIPGNRTTDEVKEVSRRMEVELE